MTHKLFYVVDGKVLETAANTHTHPVPMKVAYSIKNKLEKTTHKAGKLVVVPCDTKPEQYKLF